jgi:hypothetical protein
MYVDYLALFFKVKILYFEQAERSMADNDDLIWVRSLTLNDLQNVGTASW